MLLCYWSIEYCQVSYVKGSVAKNKHISAFLNFSEYFSMSDFKWRHYQGGVILGCVRWYCKYGISYRELEEMMLERGFEVDHTTLYRWVQHYAPEMQKRMRWYYNRV